VNAQAPSAAEPGISELLARHAADSPPHGAAGAAVLILLREGASDTEVLLIERAVRAEDRASGQVGLPGGRVEERDGALVETALREVEEEVGISGLDLVGPPRFVAVEEAAVFALKVGVFVGELAPKGRAPRVGSPAEVAHVFWLPRGALRSSRRVGRDSPRGHIEVDAVVFDGHVLWGFTRRVLMEFFDLASPGSTPGSPAPRVNQAV
jgi:8-oxo-dGTP pyrophosphatase MutT (NUDIX family)